MKRVVMVVLLILIRLFTNTGLISFPSVVNPLAYGYMLPDSYTIFSEEHELHTGAESSIMFASEAYPEVNDKIILPGMLPMETVNAVLTNTYGYNLVFRISVNENTRIDIESMVYTLHNDSIMNISRGTSRDMLLRNLMLFPEGVRANLTDQAGNSKSGRVATGDRVVLTARDGVTKKILKISYQEPVVPSAKSFHATDFKLPAWVSDHMLLPIGTPFIMTGMSEPGKVASIRFDNITASALCDENGAWEIEFPYLKPGMNGDLIFTCGDQVKVIKSVATGDTWLCSGQSNMQFSVLKSAESMEAEEAVSTLDIRYFDGIGWKLVTSENVNNLSAVAIFFAIEIARRQQGPVGIFVAARGGTSIDAWLPGEAFPDNESGRVKRPLINDPDVLKAAEEDKKDFRPVGQYRLAQWGLSRAVPSSLYEELIKPFGDLPIRGVVWYQGESNAGSVKQAKEYRLWLGNLISEYRRLWGSPVLPFMIIQLPAYDPGTPETRKAWAVLQNTQAFVVRRTKNTELVDIKDLGDLNDIHPARKKEVGERTADKVFKLIYTR